MPDVYGDGTTAAKAVENTIQGLIAAVAYMLEEGQRPPAPAREAVRSEQVNVRLTVEERQLFEAGAIPSRLQRPLRIYPCRRFRICEVRITTTIEAMSIDTEISDR